MKPVRRSSKPRFPENIPADVWKDGVEWRHVAQAQAEVRHWHANEISRMWNRWRAVQDEVMRGWHEAQLERVAALTLVIDDQLRASRLEEEEAARREWLRKDAEDTAKWVAAVKDAATRATEAEKAKLRREIAMFNRSIASSQKKVRARLKARFRPERPIDFGPGTPAV